MLNETDHKQTQGRLDDLLTADHAALDVTYRRMVGKFLGGDPDAIRAEWTLMEKQLEAHLRAEEQFILPRFESSYPDEAEQIRLEHKQIRDSLLQLGIDLDLHSLRADAGAAFIQTLRAHAQREERLLYKWAQEELPPGERHLVIENVRAVFDGLTDPV